jgi:thiamine-phosphate pyrophosphorylase
MELIVISHPEAIDQEAKLINQLFAAGMKRFHFRKPFATPAELITLLGEIDSAYFNRVVLHQHYELAKQFQISRLHHPAKVRLSAEIAIVERNPSGLSSLSTSIHNLTELQALNNYDYAFFSPVFDSISKPGYKGIIPENFSLERGGSITQVIALGGINPANICQVRQMNFDGVAALGSVWAAGSPVENFLQLTTALNAKSNDR